MTDDLIAFLRARLDEAERLARATWPEVEDADDLRNAWDDPYGEIQSRDSAAFEHIRANDPARVLRQVEAHRAIVNAYERSVRVVGEGLSVLLRNLVVALARIYSDHPDFEESWRA